MIVFMKFKHFTFTLVRKALIEHRKHQKGIDTSRRWVTIVNSAKTGRVLRVSPEGPVVKVEHSNNSI